MRIAHFLPALAFLAVSSAPASAGDLNKIDRAIPKEPVYKNQPAYCLLVFGSEARTRVWLVLDGQVLYVDRSGSGDLSQQADKVVAETPNSSYSAGDILEAERRTKHTCLVIRPHKGGSMTVSVMTEGKYRQQSGPVLFAGRPQQAPIIHFNGPVSVRFVSAVADTDRGQVETPVANLSPREQLLLQLNKNSHLAGERRQTKAISLFAIMGTLGLGEGTFATYKARDILGQPNARLAVEAAFPNQDGKAKPILVKGFLQPDS